MNCSLGPKKVKRIQLVDPPQPGMRVTSALVRGGWKHFWCYANTDQGTILWVNYKTGQWMPYDCEDSPPTVRLEIEEMEKQWELHKQDYGLPGRCAWK